MSLTEFLGFVTGAVCVWLCVKEHVANWPVGIANNVFFLVLFWRSRIYLNAGLQVVYVVLSLIGWWWWLHGGDKRDDLPVIRSSRRVALVLGAVMVAATGVMWWVEAAHTDSPVPFWDAAITVVALGAQYLLTRKIYENWWLWIAVDVVSIGVFASQHLYLTASLQVLFIAMCVQGLREWKQSMAARAVPPAVAA